MLVWLYQNLATIIISLLLAVCVGFIIAGLIKDRKKGKKSCGACCANCALCGKCPHHH